jgi:hypothetical protein
VLYTLDGVQLAAVVNFRKHVHPEPQETISVVDTEVAIGVQTPPDPIRYRAVTALRFEFALSAKAAAAINTMAPIPNNNFFLIIKKV